MVTVKQIELLHPENEDMGIIVALIKLGTKPKHIGLAKLVRRSRKEVLGYLEEREELKQELLTQHAQKNESGGRETVPMLDDEENPRMGPDGPMESVVLEDPKAYWAGLTDLLMSEVELRHTFTLDDFENQPDGFTLEDELDLLGALLVDE